MKRTIIAIALTAAMVLAAAPAAFANHSEPPPGQDRPGNEQCRPGSDNDRNGPWELQDQEAFLAAVNALFPTIDPDRIAARQNAADAIWAKCDHNLDGYLCVKLQTLPSGTVWILLDNHPFGGKG